MNLSAIVAHRIHVADRHYFGVSKNNIFSLGARKNLQTPEYATK